jgi:hypothetical protein
MYRKILFKKGKLVCLLYSYTPDTALMKSAIPICLTFVLHAFVPFAGQAFGLLSHQAIIDASWEKSIVPHLKALYPHSTEEEIKEAKAYAYGGAILPDIGYMPLGSAEFTHLVHYVRTGDFVNVLLDEAQNLEEYAFAVGMLSHYYADNFGHKLGTNRVVPLMFPREKRKHGESVSYEEARTKHVRVEYGFDVLQTAKGRYKPEEYKDFIGFKVSEPVLERAFRKVYGMKLKDVFASFKASVSTFRFTVRNLVPGMTKAAWKARKSFISKMNPLATEDNFYYNMKPSDYKKEYGKLNIKSSFVALIIGVLPKVGPLSFLRFKEPTAQGEEIYNNSYETIVRNYSGSLNGAGTGKAKMENRNLDTGGKSECGDYKLADKAYGKLMMHHSKNNFKDAGPELQKSLAEYYKSNRPESKRVSKALTALNAK